MGVAFGILSLGGTETEIHLGGHLPPPPIATYFLKNTIATLGLNYCSIDGRLLSQVMVGAVNRAPPSMALLTSFNFILWRSSELVGKIGHWDDLSSVR